MAKVLVVYYSKHGSVKQLAEAIATGISSAGAEAIIRTVPSVRLSTDPSQSEDIPETGHLYVSKRDLQQCCALALGSPSHFGNMAAPLKYFVDSLSDQWLKGSLVDKPACVFTSTSSMHGGQESTLLSMMIPLFHQGMCILGIPYSEPELHATTSGGSPYGASCLINDAKKELDQCEKVLAISLGKRIALAANNWKQTR